MTFTYPLLNATENQTRADAARMAIPRVSRAFVKGERDSVDISGGYGWNAMLVAFTGFGVVCSGDVLLYSEVRV